VVRLVRFQSGLDAGGRGWGSDIGIAVNTNISAESGAIVAMVAVLGVLRQAGSVDDDERLPGGAGGDYGGVQLRQSAASILIRCRFRCGRRGGVALLDRIGVDDPVGAIRFTE
jgi:hypothetical protein